jgi:glycosyltransferase involved in cell wall biosynthesis
VIPTLNEAATIRDKLADLQRTDYPADRLDVIIVDGGSADRTVEYVEAAIAGGAPLQLWRVAAHGKPHQINHAMDRLSHELVVVTDADSRLDPPCVRELVRALLADPRTAVVGASIRPATSLPEERLHWWGLNYLWWLEGEALSAAVVSGVCYAARRTSIAVLAHDATAEDVHISLAAAGRGLRARLSRAAWATEVRVPRTARELLSFRRRRGTDYLRELRRDAAVPVPLGARVARAIRLFHFRVTPWLVAGTLTIAIALLFTAYWRWPVLAGVALLLPPIVVLYRSRSLRADGSRRQLAVAGMRLAGLLWVSLLSLRASTSAPRPAVQQSPADTARLDAPASRQLSVDQEAGV